jgi:hypothetical protein
MLSFGRMVVPSHGPLPPRAAPPGEGLIQPQYGVTVWGTCYNLLVVSQSCLLRNFRNFSLYLLAALEWPLRDIKDMHLLARLTQIYGMYVSKMQTR